MEMNLDDFRISEEKAKTSGGFYFKPGTKLFIRTVTMALTGELVSAGDKELVLKDACWIADTGRFADFLKTGNCSESEPFPEGVVLVGRGGIIDCCEWKHDLIREQK